MKIMAINSSPKMGEGNTALILKPFLDGMKAAGAEVELFYTKKLNYTVTSNHIHLLVADDANREVIPNSINLIAGRTGQEFNRRKSRKGAFWEDGVKPLSCDLNNIDNQKSRCDLIVSTIVFQYYNLWISNSGGKIFMQNGQCSRCKSTEVYKKINGIVSGDKCVYVKGLSVLTPPSDHLTFLCSQCGYYEDYIVDSKVLQKIKEKWEKA